MIYFANLLVFMWKNGQPLSEMIGHVYQKWLAMFYVKELVNFLVTIL